MRPSPHGSCRIQPMTNHLPGQRMHVLIGAGSRAPATGRLIGWTASTAAEVSNYVTRVRNAGADIFLIIDTRLAAQWRSPGLAAAARAPAIGPSMARPCCSMAAFHPNRTPPIHGTRAAVRGRGEYAVLYASRPRRRGYEYAQGAGARCSVH